MFKVVLLGEVGVGKTALFYRIKDDVFNDSSCNTTVGIDSCSRLVSVGKNPSAVVTVSPTVVRVGLSAFMFSLSAVKLSECCHHSSECCHGVSEC